MSESWTGERLRDGGVTSASNESSVILYANLEEGRRILLTGDAARKRSRGPQPMRGRAATRSFSLVQIPHHGSRRNVGPAILNELLGPIQPEGTIRFTAFVSAPKDDDIHPRKIVLNAFIRRGGKVIATQGAGKIHYGGFPKRNGYVDVEPMPFSSKVATGAVGPNSTVSHHLLPSVLA